MKTTYLIWKNQNCDGVNPDWQEISGQEFLALVRSESGTNRRFVKLDATNGDGSDSAIVMEATEIEYQEWKREKNHRDYLNSYAKGTTTILYNDWDNEEEDVYGEELLADSYNLEEEFFKSHDLASLKTALSLLSDEERQTVECLYLSEKPMAERDYAKFLGISNGAAHYKKVAVLGKLKSLIKNNF